MIETQHPKLSVRRQCELVGVNRNRLTPRETKITREDHAIMKTLDLLYMKWPFLGARKLKLELIPYGWKIGRKRVRRLMRLMGIEALVPKPSLSIPDKSHKVYPYLLGNLEIIEADQVWCADITYLPMEKGHAYLVAIMDWKTRAVLAWEVSNTMESGFCVRALRNAMRSTGRKPGIFNTDQGSQFTSHDYTSCVLSRSIEMSMDGKGRALDNVFIERLWRSVKYEDIYLRDYVSGTDCEKGLRSYFKFYCHERPHQALDFRTPWEVHHSGNASRRKAT